MNLTLSLALVNLRYQLIKLRECFTSLCYLNVIFLPPYFSVSVGMGRYRDSSRLQQKERKDAERTLALVVMSYEVRRFFFKQKGKNGIVTIQTFTGHLSERLDCDIYMCSYEDSCCLLYGCDQSLLFAKKKTNTVPLIS